MARRPEVIVVLDYGEQSAEQKIAFLRSLPVLRSVPAVRDDRFFVLDYNEGISNVDGLERFGAYLRSLPR